MLRSTFSTANANAWRSAAAVLLIGAAAPATAAADSLVFVKDHNVFLAAPDGSKLTAVTTDGTADSPYRSPSQSDDGTIAASKDRLILRLRQNGEVINTIDPPELRTSASTPIDGVPVAVAISPDGTKIAYQYATYNCPIGVSCMGRSATGVTWADRPTPATAFATTYFNHPRWVGNNRLVVGGGYLSHANLVDVNAVGVAPTHWFDDQDYFSPSSDLGQTSVSRDGSRVASIHGYDGGTESNKRLVWFKSTADPRTAPLPPSNPEALCVTSVVPGLEDPVWSPSGDGLAFVIPEGIQVATSVPRDEDSCAAFSSTLVFPGASEPDWGPADVNPQPRTQPTPGGGTGT
ncbi:MAG: hypothetical protein JHD16_18065, partial [Solirubrobacteraceae bacterium]|nr:hypothetical protein [Solirubrobacteraceae bacterium]